MVSHEIMAHIVEMLFWRSNENRFALNVYHVEELFDIRFHDTVLHDYFELHQALRDLGVIFSYMAKSDTCGFQRLYDINKWEMLKPDDIKT